MKKRFQKLIESSFTIVQSYNYDSLIYFHMILSLYHLNFSIFVISFMGCEECKYKKQKRNKHTSYILSKSGTHTTLYIFIIIYMYILIYVYINIYVYIYNYIYAYILIYVYIKK